MNTEDIGAHRAIASAMNYCDLCRIIADLMFEIHSLSPHLTKNEIKKYHKALSIYKDELNFVINLSSTRNSSILTH